MFAIALMAATPDRCGAAFDEGRVEFTVHVNGEASSYRVLGVFVMPGETMSFRVNDGRRATYTVEAAGGRLVQQGAHRWAWSSQASGLYPIRIVAPEAGQEMTLNVFVMTSASRVHEGMLNGYRIGAYPKTRLHGLPIYDPPRGFVEVTAENHATPVSPHFTLGQFLCKQEGGFPKYVVLRERLLLKLELILAKANEVGIACETFHVMSGYRTPYYNKKIGNVKYSRHQWGGAADIFVDVSPRDDFMDDLNGDGKIDVLDAGVLYELVDGMYGKPYYSGFVGGLGRYRKTANHPPFVHVDTRGFHARWGD